MTPSPAIALRQTDHAILDFLREQLAPSQDRWRDALRLTLQCVLATTLVLTWHIPFGEFLIIFFFAVSQPDAWASLRKAWARGVSTLIGATLAILAIITLADKPWLFLPFQAAFFAGALFLCRTTTMPYAFVLAMLTFALITPSIATDPDSSLVKACWRIILTLAGAVIGTVAQITLWPNPPQRQLRQRLAERLGTVEVLLGKMPGHVGGGTHSAHRTVETQSAAAAMANELELLASAETRSQTIRARHAENLKLVTGVELILINAFRFKRLAKMDSAPDTARANYSARIEGIRSAVRRLRRALKQGDAIEQEILAPIPVNLPHDDLTEAALSKLESYVQQVGEILKGWIPRGVAASENGETRVKVQSVPRAPIFTPDCRLSNLDALHFALKGSLAASICYVIYQSLNWPGISTCVVTCLIAAQSSVGAGLRRSMLRVAGALLGAVGALGVIVVGVPNMDSVAPYIVATGLLFFAASWLTVGGSQVSYAGMQTALVLALVLFNQPMQTLNLAPVGDRIVGVLLGISVMGFIDVAFWPAFAGTNLPRKVANSLSSLAQVPRFLARRDLDQAEAAILTVPAKIVAAQALYDEWQLEYDRQVNRNSALARNRHRVLEGCEEVFEGLVVIVQLRRNLEQQDTSKARQLKLTALDEALARRLEGLADRTRGLPVESEFSARLTEFAAAVPSETDPAQRMSLLDYSQAMEELAASLDKLTTAKSALPPRGLS